MAITIKGNGYNYSVPSELDLRTFEDETELGGIIIPGRDGIVINKNAIRRGNLRLILRGILTGTSTNDFESKFETLSKVVNSSPEPLVIDTGVRTIRARKVNMSHERIPSGGTRMPIAITFISEDGYWQEEIPTAEVSLGTFAANPKTVLKSVTVAGTYKTYPVILLKPTATIQDPVITWYGRNLIKNSNFADGETDWIASGIDSAESRIEKYANKYVARVANDSSYRQVNIPCNEQTTYYVSGYGASTGTAKARIYLWWYDSSDTFLDSAYIEESTGASSLTRFSGQMTSPANAVYFRLYIRSSIDDDFVYITDIQVEESSSLSEYMSSQNVEFDVSGNETFVNNDIIEIDCEKKTVRYWDSAVPQWSNIIDKSNAQFFPLIPGKNLLSFYQEYATGNMEVLVRYSDRYLGY